MSLLVEGTPQDPLVVVRSRLWQFNGIGFFSGDEAVVVDPGIDPTEIALLTERVTTAHRDGPPRRVTHVLVTHSHHDHIRGWSRFEGAEVILPRVAAEKDEAARGRILAAKHKIDQHLEVDDPGFAYPEADRVFDEQVSVRCGELTLEMRFLPGHSNCTSVVWVPQLRTLCTADYLVSPGLPYCRWQATAFDEALATLRRWVDELGVERIVPAHRELHLGRDAVFAAIAADEWAMRRTREL
ncbi:MAG: MBL fold metallo-hydrolase, partial [Planctomycetota bacterium]|nr:MBL fold metallo-hydrolase [Planctomycetota bacterium]